MAQITTGELAQNFGRIIRHYQGSGQGLTKIAKMMGYTSTSQLNNSMEGESLLSTKAILAMINTLGVNPNYLFLKKGEMFLTGDEDQESQYNILNKEYQDLQKEYSDSLEKIEQLNEKLNAYEKLVSNLLLDTASLVKSFNATSQYVKITKIEGSDGITDISR